MSKDTAFDPYVVEVRTYNDGDVIIEEGRAVDPKNWTVV